MAKFTLKRLSLACKTLAARRSPDSSIRLSTAESLLILLLAVSLMAACSSCDRSSRDEAEGSAPSGLLPWIFQDGRIVSAGGKTTLVGILMSANWAVVTDSDSRKTAWLPVPETEMAPVQTLEEGNLWVREGIIRGPVEEVPEQLADKQLIRYKWEVVRDDENSLTVTYTASLMDHVVLASFSNLRITLPLSLYVGAKATIDETHGGVILPRFHGGPSHPSYWEGPARHMRLEGRDLTFELTTSEGGFTWTSLVDGRALAKRDTSLVIQLYPAVAGPREKLGTLAWKGTSYSASFTLRLSPASTEPGVPVSRLPVAAVPPPADLPSAVLETLDSSFWELEPFGSAERTEVFPLSLGSRPLWCNLPLESESAAWKLEVGGPGEPVPAFVCLRGPVKDFRLKINGAGDFRDPRSLLDQIEPLPLDPRARAEKIWRYAAGITYAMPVNPTDDLGEFLGSYGYGISSTLSAMALVRLWGSAGLCARRVFVTGSTGHAVLGEVYYDGDWHAYDLQERTFYIDPDDWSVASAAEISSRPDLVRFNSDAGGRSPSGEPADEVARAEYEGARLSYNPGSFSFVRLLRTSLRRGETFVRFYRSLGRWAPAPREPDYYANALLAFCADLSGESAFDGFSGVQNFQIRDGAMVHGDPSRPAWFEYRAASPYVIVESTLRIGCDPSALEGASLLVSKDEGKTWITASLDEETGRADITTLLAPRTPEPGAAHELLERNFQYLVHVELPPCSSELRPRIREVTVLTWSQMNEAVLPRLRLGHNEIEATCEEWGPGASLSLAWVETGLVVQPDRPFLGEPFDLLGEVLAGGKSQLGRLAVSAYAEGASGPLEMGTWRPDSSLKAGDKNAFKVSCVWPDVDRLCAERLPRQLDTMVEIVEGDASQRPAPWDARSEVAVDFRYKPDLVLVPGLVKVSPQTPHPGEHVDVGVYVRNFYPTRECLFPETTTVPSVNVALYELDGESRNLVQRVSLSEIPPGGGATAFFQWTAPSKPGARTLLVVVDPDDEIAERDERNAAALDVEVLDKRSP